MKCLPRCGFRCLMSCAAVLYCIAMLLLIYKMLEGHEVKIGALCLCRDGYNAKHNKTAPEKYVSELQRHAKEKTFLLVDDIPGKNKTTVKFGSRSRAVVFLKAFKVGGTTISSILSSYAFNAQLNMQRIDLWCKGYLISSTGHCIDVIGTHHPRHLPCAFTTIDSPYFCNPPEVFIMLRDPVDRLWSGYKHEVKIAGKQFPLSKFLKSESGLKTPPHHLLDNDIEKAIEKASSIHILLHHLYDQSLVYMAMKTGMKFCDIMYAPCNHATWGATKCNTDTNIVRNKSDVAALRKHATITGEHRFYKSLLDTAENKLKSARVRKATAIYRRIKDTVLKRCLRPGVLDSITEMFKHHPYVRRDRGGQERLFHFQTEMVNPLDPLTVCLGWFCSEL